jgi:hypothetical protein
MKNAQKVAAAQELLNFIKTTGGFDDAYLVFCDEEGNVYESIEDVAADTLDDEVTVSIEIVLDEELTFNVEEGEEKETRIIYAP